MFLYENMKIQHSKLQVIFVLVYKQFGEKHIIREISRDI